MSLFAIPFIAFFFYVYLVATKRTVFRMRSEQEVAEEMPKHTMLAATAVFMVSGIITLVGDIGVKASSGDLDDISESIK